MLSQETIQIIKSTVPVLEIHGTAITSAFYKKLFHNHPELLNIFNHANQREGKQPFEYTPLIVPQPIIPAFIFCIAVTP